MLNCSEFPNPIDNRSIRIGRAQVFHQAIGLRPKVLNFGLGTTGRATGRAHAQLACGLVDPKQRAPRFCTTVLFGDLLHLDLFDAGQHERMLYIGT